jgi:hypothetical protein
MRTSVFAKQMRSAALAAISVGVVAGLVLVPAASATNRPGTATTIKLKAPMEIPGNQVLPAGTYIFRELGQAQPNEPDMIQIYQKDQNRFVAMVPTIKTYRVSATGTPVIRFEERAANAPPAIHTWFNPGHHWGHEFLYNTSPSLGTSPTAGE